MKSTTLGPSRTAPKSSTTRGELRMLHVPTSSRLKRLSGTWDQTAAGISNVRIVFRASLVSPSWLHT